MRSRTFFIYSRPKVRAVRQVSASDSVHEHGYYLNKSRENKQTTTNELVESDFKHGMTVDEGWSMPRAKSSELMASCHTTHFAEGREIQMS